MRTSLGSVAAPLLAGYAAPVTSFDGCRHCATTFSANSYATRSYAYRYISAPGPVVVAIIAVAVRSDLDALRLSRRSKRGCG